MSGDEKVALLLGALPPGAVEPILAYLEPAIVERLRTLLKSPPKPKPEQMQQVAREFADLRRIAERPQAIQVAAPSPATAPARPEPDAPPAEPDAVQLLRGCAPEALARALRDERASSVSLVLGFLETAQATAVLKLLPPEVRHEALARQARPVALNDDLVERILRLVLSRCRAPAEKAPRPTGDDLVTRLAELIRSQDGTDRKEVLDRLERSDAAIAEKVRKQLYRFADLLRVPDRTLQGILGEVDGKTLALALKDAPAEIKGKVLANLSRRAQQNLAEQMEMLSSVPPAQVAEAQDAIIQILRRLDQEGQLA
ncbi:MAG: hypothetical protein K2W96_26945 [Gemmataceae bacterium]|nr:hypothetical protein [Gemmataceae bacterium]